MFETVACLTIGFCAHGPEKTETTDEMCPGVDIAGRRVAEKRLFNVCQFDLECRGDGQGNFVLDREYIGQLAIKAGRPDQIAGSSVGKLHRKADVVSDFRRLPVTM